MINTAERLRIGGPAVLLKDADSVTALVTVAEDADATDSTTNQVDSRSSYKKTYLRPFSSSERRAVILKLTQRNATLCSRERQCPGSAQYVAGISNALNLANSYLDKTELALLRQP